jgi:hypothetical protein
MVQVVAVEQELQVECNWSSKSKLEDLVEMELQH